MNAPGSVLSISVVICTRNRVQSLRETLESLALADRHGLIAEIIVVNNGGSKETDELVISFEKRLIIQLLHESKPGKAHALNRALDEGRLGQITAVLDDDITVDPQWFQGIRKICERWPSKGFFTGRTTISWPSRDQPSWATHPSLRGWAFSIVQPSEDYLIPEDRWVSGNHFWFRTCLLRKGFRFDTSRREDYIEMTEPKLMLDLAAAGFGGVAAPDAEAQHRIQPELIDIQVLEQRAVQVGRGFAQARLVPFRRTVKQAVLFRRFPLLARLFCVANLGRWSIFFILANLSIGADHRIVRRFHARERIATYREYLRIASTDPEYHK